MESQPLLRVINEFRLLRSKGVASAESNLILLMSGVLPLHQLAPRLAVGEFKNYKKLILTPPLNVIVTVACATVGRSNIYCCFLSCLKLSKNTVAVVCNSPPYYRTFATRLPPLLIAHVQTLSLCYISLRQVEESNLLAS